MTETRFNSLNEIDGPARKNSSVVPVNVGSSRNTIFLKNKSMKKSHLVEID